MKIPKKLLLAGVLFIVCTQSVSANEPEALLVEPAFQEVVIDRSEASASAKIFIRNQSKNEQILEFFPVLINQFSSAGTIELVDKPLSKLDFNRAQQINIENVATISAGLSKEIPITINNTQDLSPGGTYVALIAKLVNNKSDEQVVVPAISTFLLIRKEGGEQYHLSVKKSSIFDKILFSLPKEMEVTFVNNGNVHTIPQGKVEVYDIFGRMVKKGIVNESSLYVFPNTERPISIRLFSTAVQLPFGLLRVNLSGQTHPGNFPFSQEGWIIYVQWKALAFVLLLCLVLIFLFLRKKQKQRQRK